LGSVRAGKSNLNDTVRGSKKRGGPGAPKLEAAPHFIGAESER
jgi:hypothetical protein